MMDQFLSLMIDPFAADGRDANLGGPALGYDRDPQLTKLPPEAGAAYARALRSPRPVTEFERRWSIWGTAFGGYNKTNGDPVVAGTNTVTARDYGLAAGLDYRLTSSTTVGVALAGGATNWGLANGLGGGNSDAFQAGVYGIWRNAGAYLSGAAAFANHWMSTDRVAFASDSLTAKFNAKVYGGRIEAGYRVAVTPLAGLTPYAAVQSQVYRTPDYIETDVSGGGFGLAFAARSVTDTRVEVGARIDGRTAAGNGMDVIFRSRIAWAHDWVSDNTLTATFQALPGASFVVNGAAAPKSLLLANTAAELRLTPATSVTVKLDTELGHGSQTYASTATLRYRW